MHALTKLGIIAISLTLIKAKGYHDMIGIPTAAKIQAAETEDVLSETPGVATKVLGGDRAILGSYPFMGGLLIRFSGMNLTSTCGSSLISADRLVTAGHCWFDGKRQANSFEVVLGSEYLFYGGLRVHTSKVIAHPLWNPNHLAMADIAVIFLPYKVNFNQFVSPVALPDATFQGPLDHEWAYAAGYGWKVGNQPYVHHSTNLNHVRLLVLSHTECSQGPYAEIYESHICTSGQGFVGICQGDSGGPLVVKRNNVPVLVGVTSFVWAGGCQEGYPSVFTRITSFLDFILANL